MDLFQRFGDWFFRDDASRAIKAAAQALDEASRRQSAGLPTEALRVALDGLALIRDLKPEPSPAREIAFLSLVEVAEQAAEQLGVHGVPDGDLANAIAYVRRVEAAEQAHPDIVRLPPQMATQLANTRRYLAARVAGRDSP